MADSPSPEPPPFGPPLLEVSGVTHDFDVSRPFLRRVLSGEGRRLLRAVNALDYPRELLEVQVLDDSTDDTRELIEGEVAALRARGLDVHYIHRTDRTGFKAGALEHGMHQARGEFIFILDADFVPKPDSEPVKGAVVGTTDLTEGAKPQSTEAQTEGSAPEAPAANTAH